MRPDIAISPVSSKFKVLQPFEIVAATTSMTQTYSILTRQNLAPPRRREGSAAIRLLKAQEVAASRAAS
jgi:hypothetical protein